MEPVLKVCHECGKAHVEVPENARYGGSGLMEGLYFECCSGSTLFVPMEKVIRYQAAQYHVIAMSLAAIAEMELQEAS